MPAYLLFYIVLLGILLLLNIDLYSYIKHIVIHLFPVSKLWRAVFFSENISNREKICISRPTGGDGLHKHSASSWCTSCCNSDCPVQCVAFPCQGSAVSTMYGLFPHHSCRQLQPRHSVYAWDVLHDMWASCQFNPLIWSCWCVSLYQSAIHCDEVSCVGDNGHGCWECWIGEVLPLPRLTCHASQDLHDTFKSDHYCQHGGSDRCAVWVCTDCTQCVQGPGPIHRRIWCHRSHRQFWRILDDSRSQILVWHRVRRWGGDGPCYRLCSPVTVLPELFVCL